MTTTRAPTSRTTTTAFAVLTKDPSQARPIVVTIHGDTLNFRLKGAKIGWNLAIDKAMRYALLHDVPIAKGLEQQTAGPGFVEPADTFAPVFHWHCSSCGQGSTTDNSTPPDTCPICQQKGPLA